MTKSSTIQISEYFEVSCTEELRDLFERTHQMTSASLPVEQQFTHHEQNLMLLACRALPERDASAEDVAHRESDLCELLHYLVMSGVPVPSILGEVRTFTQRTRGLAIQLSYQQRKATLEEEQRAAVRKTSELIFRAPDTRVLEEVMA